MSHQEREILYGIAYMWNLKNNANKYIAKQKWTHRYRKQTRGYQWGEGRGRGKTRIGK